MNPDAQRVLDNDDERARDRYRLSHQARERNRLDRINDELRGVAEPGMRLYVSPNVAARLIALDVAAGVKPKRYRIYEEYA